MRIEDIDETWDAVTVWAESSNVALSLAAEWIDATDRRPLYGRPHNVRDLGHDPDPRDLGVAARHRDVNHIRLTQDGHPLDTRYRKASDVHPWEPDDQ